MSSLLLHHLGSCQAYHAAGAAATSDPTIHSPGGTLYLITKQGLTEDMTKKIAVLSAVHLEPGKIAALRFNRTTFIAWPIIASICVRMLIGRYDFRAMH